MKTETANRKVTPLHSIARVLIATVAVLSVPLIAMQFNSEWDWDLRDFVTIGLLLISAGFTYEIISRKVSDITRRLALAIAIIAVVLILWAELSVGIFGSPIAGS